MAYNPVDHIAQNKPFGTSDKPLDGKLMFYDKINFKYRPFVSTAEVLSYFTGNFRKGNFEIIINTGGVLSNGVITGGTNAIWWFADGIADSDLVQKFSPAQNLQGVTNGVGNNITTNVIKVTGIGNLDFTGDGIQMLHSPDNSSSGLVKTVGGLPVNNLEFTPLRTQLGYLGTTISTLDLNSETGLLAGANFNSRVSINPAINLTEAVTLGQLNSAIPLPLIFGNGLRNDSGVIKIGLDLTTIGTTNLGILSETTALAYGNLVTGAWRGVTIEADKTTLVAGTSFTDSVTINANINGDLSLRKLKGGIEQSILFSAANDNIVVTDTVSGTGFLYGDNYATSGLWSTTPRAIPDVGFIQGNFAGLTSNNNFSGSNTFTNGVNQVTIDPAYLRASSTFLNSYLDVTAQNIVYSQGTFVQSLGNEILTADRNVRLPDASGTLTLRTDVILNQLSVQTSSNFNISGVGTIGDSLTVNGGSIISRSTTTTNPIFTVFSNGVGETGLIQLWKTETNAFSAGLTKSGKLTVGPIPGGASNAASIYTYSIMNQSTAYGVIAQGVLESGAGNVRLLATTVSASASGTYTVNSLSHFYADVQSNFPGNATITSQYGLHIPATIKGGTNNYGIYSSIASDANNTWNMYLVGTAKNYINASLFIGTNVDSGYKLDVNGTVRVSSNLTVTNNTTAAQYNVQAMNAAPASAGAIGTTGEVRITAGFIYVCTATNTWVRTALTSW